MGINLSELEAEPFELITLERLQDICFIKKITPPYYFAQRSAPHIPLPNSDLVEVHSGNQQQNWKLLDAWHRAAIRAAEKVYGKQLYPIGDQEVWASDEEEEEDEEAATEETHQADHTEDHIETQHERGESSHQQTPRRTTVYERRSRLPRTQSSTEHAWDEWNVQLHALTEAQTSFQQQWAEEIVQRLSFEEEQRRSFEE